MPSHKKTPGGIPPGVVCCVMVRFAPRTKQKTRRHRVRPTSVLSQCGRVLCCFSAKHNSSADGYPRFGQAVSSTRSHHPSISENLLPKKQAFCPSHCRNNPALAGYSPDSIPYQSGSAAPLAHPLPQPERHTPTRQHRRLNSQTPTNWEHWWVGIGRTEAVQAQTVQDLQKPGNRDLPNPVPSFALQSLHIRTVAIRLFQSQHPQPVSGYKDPDPLRRSCGQESRPIWLCCQGGSFHSPNGSYRCRRCADFPQQFHQVLPSVLRLHPKLHHTAVFQKRSRRSSKNAFKP